MWQGGHMSGSLMPSRLGGQRHLGVLCAQDRALTCVQLRGAPRPPRGQISQPSPRLEADMLVGALPLASCFPPAWELTARKTCTEM